MSSPSYRITLPGAPLARSWGSEPGAFSVTRSVVLVLAAAALLGACSAGGAPATGPASPSDPIASVSPSPVGPGGSPSPILTPTGSPAVGVPVPPIDTAEEALAAVAAADPRFLGYAPRDPNRIGQANYVEVTQRGDAFELVFSSGSGDCPAGCIERSFEKFVVRRDGSVEHRCSWSKGETDAGTPC